MIASLPDIVRTLGGGERDEGWVYGGPQAGPRPYHDGSQTSFEFGRDLFKGIEVWAVGGQEPQANCHMGAGEGAGNISLQSGSNVFNKCGKTDRTGRL